MAIQARAVQKPLDFRGYVVLLTAYAVFYLFMAGWMALHLGVMVGNMNEFQNLDRVCDTSTEPCRGVNFDGTVPADFEDFAAVYGKFVAAPEQEYVGMGMPAYQGFFQNAFTTANEASGDALSPDPWNANEKFQTSLGHSSKACLTQYSNFSGNDCALSGQIRINNNWRMRTTYVPVNVTCRATPSAGNPVGAGITTRAIFNPWNLTAGAFQVVDSDGTTKSVGQDVAYEANVDGNISKDLFSWNWNTGHVFPHIAQFVVVPNATVRAGETWSFNLDCNVNSAISFENNRMKYGVSFSTPE